MKFIVAFLLVPSFFTSGVVLGQSPSRKGNQSEVNKPRGDTLRVCQGVPIPDGYVIVAYMTSSACPHGAYLLKKQNDYESSLGINGGRPATEEKTNTANATAVKESGTGSQPGKGSNQSARRSNSPVKPSPNLRNSSKGSVPTSAGASASVTRPRRVGSTAQGPANSGDPQPAGASSTSSTPPQTVAQKDDTAERPAGPPTLIGSDPARTLGPPTLAKAGTSPSGSPVSNNSNAVAEPTPEEVDEGDIVRVETSLVTVPVSVLDRQGRFISNLKREDFSIFENGVEQAVAYFEPAEKPFTVALLLDTSASTRFHLSDIREAAIAFAKQLRPQDRVLIVSFSDEVLLLTEATNDLNLVETVIDEGVNPGNSTRLYDAVYLAIRERLNKVKGRKAMVLFTDGVDTSSQEATYHSTLSEIDELDALIYPIQYDTSDYMRAMQGAGNGTVTVTTTSRGIFGTTTSTQTYGVPMNGGAPLPGSTKADYDRANRYLHALADKTGGRLYQANDTTQLAQAFASIAEELRRQYSLGYYPKSDGSENNERRQIRVKVRQPNLAVKAREGYSKSNATSPSK